MIAHVGYDIEAIGPFIDAMEAATRDQCVAVLTDRSPASVADPFWPLVHGEDRVPLPALPDLLEILHSRGRATEVVRVERPPRTFDSVPALTAFLRRQLFIAEGGEKDLHFRAVLPDRIVEPRRRLDPARPADGLDRHRHLGSSLGRLTRAHRPEAATVAVCSGCERGERPSPVARTITLTPALRGGDTRPLSQPSRNPAGRVAAIRG